MIKKILIICFLASTVVYSTIDPKTDYLKTPADYNIQFTNFKIKTQKISLNSWLSVSDKHNNNLIIVAYGDYGNMSYYLDYVNFYISQGFDVLSFDYRGFGKSSDFNIDKDYLYYNEFVLDLVNAINFSKKNYNYDKIGILGLSMGSIISVLAQEKTKVDFMIMDGCVLNIDNILKRLDDVSIKIPSRDSQNLEEYWQSCNNKLLIHSASKDFITTKGDAVILIDQDDSKRKIFEYSGKHLSFTDSNINLNTYNKLLTWLIN